MDLVGGITAVKLAVDLAKDLRSIDKSVDEATYKLKLADLPSALADTQLALTDAKLQLAELESKLKTATQGDVCPVCREGRLMVVRTDRHDTWTEVEFHTTKCNFDGCAYGSTRQYDMNRGIYTARSE